MALFARKKKVAETPEPDEVVEQLPAPPPLNESGMRRMEDHRDYLLSLVEPLPAFAHSLIDAMGLSSCEDIESDIDLPGFDNSAMDGYAVHAADTAGADAQAPVVMEVLGEVAAGDTERHTVPPGAVIKIMTGAPMPLGADAVVPYESTDRGSTDVQIFRPAEAGQHVRRQGDDIRVGDEILATGQEIHARTVGVLAGIGIDAVLVRPRPRVVVISTGSELVPPGHKLTDTGQIYDSNSFLLAAAAKAEGAQVYRVGLVPDDPDKIRETISDQLLRADLILSTGGVSQGDYDLVKSVMPELGLTDFCEVAMQPGKPQGFGLIGEDKVPMVMLPGNPVSAFVSFQAFVRPLLRKMMGAEPILRPEVTAISSRVVRSSRGKRQFIRAVATLDVSGQRSVEPIGGHGSHLLGDLSRSNALIIMGEEEELVAAGDPVSVWLLNDHE